MLTLQVLSCAGATSVSNKPEGTLCTAWPVASSPYYPITLSKLRKVSRIMISSKRCLYVEETAAQVSRATSISLVLKMPVFELVQEAVNEEE
jgi:hypothetical protein